jgi:hypothetical protein
MKKKNKKAKKTVTPRDPFAYQIAVRTGSAAGNHKNRTRDLNRGSSRKVKHKNKKDW